METRTTTLSRVRAVGLALALAVPGLARGQQALLVQDSSPWGYAAWTSTLSSQGIPYAQISAAQLSSTSLSGYDMVITASVQGGSYNGYINAASAQLENYVMAGGVLVFSACTQSSHTPYPIPPFGGSNTYFTSSTGTLVDPTHPLVAGVSNPFTGNSASHNYITAYPGAADVLVTGDHGFPTLYEYSTGNGLLIVSTLTLEWGWGSGYDMGIILENAVSYGWAYNPCADVDADGDGWTDCDGDCDDSSPWTYPGAAEACDGIDNDCDGTVPVDERDGDGDGWAECDGDCDDNDAGVHPLATEVCDGVDNDCDSLVDEGFDGDGDGFSTCDGDCDDGDASIYPGAPDPCDGIDQDCGGDLDAEADADGDGWRACDGDYDDTRADTHPGAEEICDGRDNDCDPLTDDNADVDGDGQSICQGDCDDDDPTTFVGAEEICDGVDNDCDGMVDNGFDQDGDGYAACGGGDDEDCDDADPAVHPGANEVCDDGIDNDCDGLVDGEDESCAGAGDDDDGSPGDDDDATPPGRDDDAVFGTTCDCRQGATSSDPVLPTGILAAGLVLGLVRRRGTGRSRRTGPR